MVDRAHVYVVIEGRSIDVVSGIYNLSKVCPCSSAWFAGRDFGSCLLIVLWCSVSRVSTFFDVSPMYCCGQPRQGDM